VKWKLIREVGIEQIYKAFESYFWSKIVVFWPCQGSVEVAVRYGCEISEREIIG
jgi:hypothetical protein